MSAWSTDPCTPRRTNDDRLPDPRRDPVPLHRGDGARHRARVAGPVGGGGHFPGSQPGRSVGRAREGRRSRQRSWSSSTCSRTRAARAARRPPAGLHRHGCVCPLPPDARQERPALPGLRRVRAAGRAVRRADRPAPAQDDRGQHGRHAPPAAAAGAGFDDAAQLRDHRRGLLQVDAVDIPADLQLLVRPGGGAGPAARALRGRSRRWSGDRGRAGGRCRTARPWADLSEAEQEAVLAEERLAYIAEAPVNWSPAWAPSCPTRRSPTRGASERGNFPVFRRSLRQWMMRITAYADRLADDLDRVDWPEKVKTMQRNWIGRSHGARIDFAVDRPGAARRSRSSRPDPTPCSARRSWCWLPSTRWSTRS